MYFIRDTIFRLCYMFLDSTNSTNSIYFVTVDDTHVLLLWRKLRD